jgi:DNA-binding response OmpR family regulator
MDTDGCVVILEEDPLIRPLVERWLLEAGYRVAAAGDTTERTCSLVIADVPDPQSAEALLRTVRGYAAPILVVSARFRRGLAGSMDAARMLGVKKVLPKPFSREEFLSAVRESLDGAT